MPTMSRLPPGPGWAALPDAIFRHSALPLRHFAAGDSVFQCISAVGVNQLSCVWAGADVSRSSGALGSAGDGLSQADESAVAGDGFLGPASNYVSACALLFSGRGAFNPDHRVFISLGYACARPLTRVSTFSAPTRPCHTPLTLPAFQNRTAPHKTPPHGEPTGITQPEL